jgi:hypothetical protein
MTVAEYRLLNPNDPETDQALEAKLQALESVIRAYTNNNFQQRAFRFSCPVINGKLYYTTNLLKVDDTVQISESALNDGLYIVQETGADTISLDAELYDEDYVLVTKVIYPHDVKMGVVNLPRWENENRSKVGIASETISRHSVTYFNMDGDNSLMGYPKSLLGFLTPYMKARF